MLAHIGLLDLLLLLDRTHLLLGIEHMPRHLPVAGNALDLGMCRVLLLQRLLVVEIDSLAWTYHAQLLGGLRLPHAHVHLVGAGENVSIIQGPGHTDHMLHAFRVINIPGVAVMGIVNADSLVVAGGDEFLARGRVVHIGDGGNMIEVHLKGSLQLAGVKCIEAGKERESYTSDNSSIY